MNTHRLRSLTVFAALVPLFSWVAACGSDGDSSQTGSNSAGTAGTSGSSNNGGSSGSGASATGGSGGGQGGNSGTSGTAGTSGNSGTSGSGGSSMGGTAGQSGASGSAGSSGSTGGSAGTGATAGTGGVAGSAGTAGSTGGSAGTSACPDGMACDPNGICVNDACCPINSVCGDVCCGQAEYCSFGQCVTPGIDCSDSSDCAQDQYCELALGNGAGGSGGQCNGPPVIVGKCLPEPPICAPNDPGAGTTCIAECEYIPPTQTFEPVLKYSWGGQNTPPYSTDVMMAPIVVQLDDDNCDGKVNQNDIPEIVFSTFTGGGYYKQGTLHAISIVDGQVVDKWSAANMVQPGGGLAAADLDGDGVPEIVGCMNPGPSGASCCDALAQNTGVIAFRADGSQFWTQTDTTQVHCGYEPPSIADLDHDGIPEVIVGWTVLDGVTGAVKKVVDPTNTVNSWGVKLTGVADLDGDGNLDITDGQRAYRADGSVIWDLSSGPNAITKGYHAIGDFDLDGKPEVVVISSSGPHRMHLVQHDPSSADGAKVIRRSIDINAGTSTATFCGAASEYGGGPPTVADFNGDGIPDIGAAGAVGYIVFDGSLLMNPNIADNALTLWFKTTHDCSSAVTGSSVFDFNGDGQAEVIYSDEYHLWMYDGATGDNLITSTCNTTGTLWEYPLVADVDNDGQADIIVASNAYAITCPDNASKQSGIRIFGSANGTWVKTRRIWNQHTYHVTNINEDGSVPAFEPINWTQPGLNNYRQNKQPGQEFAAPDVVAAVNVICGPPHVFGAVVRNVGQAVLPAGAVVEFFVVQNGTDVSLGTSTTTQPLFPAQGELVSITPADDQILQAGDPVYVTVTTTANECRTDNNTSAQVLASCKVE